MAECCPTPICPGPLAANIGNPQIPATCFRFPKSTGGFGGIGGIEPNVPGGGDPWDRKINIPIKNPFGGEVPPINCECVVSFLPIKKRWRLEGNQASTIVGAVCYRHRWEWKIECQKIPFNQVGNINEINQRAMNEIQGQIAGLRAGGGPGGGTIHPGSITVTGIPGIQSCLPSGQGIKGANAVCIGTCENVVVEFIECFPGPQEDCRCVAKSAGTISCNTLPQVTEGQSEICCKCFMTVTMGCEFGNASIPDPGLERIKSQLISGGNSCKRGGVEPGSTYKVGSLKEKGGGGPCEVNPLPPCENNTCNDVDLEWEECFEPGQGPGGVTIRPQDYIPPSLTGAEECECLIGYRGIATGNIVCTDIGENCCKCYWDIPQDCGKKLLAGTEDPGIAKVKQAIAEYTKYEECNGIKGEVTFTKSKDCTPGKTPKYACSTRSCSNARAEWTMCKTNPAEEIKIEIREGKRVGPKTGEPKICECLLKDPGSYQFLVCNPIPPTQEDPRECCECSWNIPQDCQEVKKAGEVDPNLSEVYRIVNHNPLCGGNTTIEGGINTIKPVNCIGTTTGAAACSTFGCAPVTVKWRQCEPLAPGGDPGGSPGDPPKMQAGGGGCCGNTPQEPVQSSIQDSSPRTYFPPSNMPQIEQPNQDEVLKPTGLEFFGSNLPQELRPPPPLATEDITINPALLTETPINPNNEFYKRTKVLEVPISNALLKYAHNTTPTNRGSDPGNILNSTIPKWLEDVLGANGGAVFKAYNGTTIGANLFQPQVFESSLSKIVSEYLENINSFNNTSVELKTHLIQALERAVNNGVLSGYSPKLFEKIINTSKSKFPQGISQINNMTNQEQAYSLLRNKKSSLDPQYWAAQGDGDEERVVQRYRILGGETKPKMAVITKSGVKTHIGVHTEELKIITRDISKSPFAGTVVTPTLTNEFLPVTLRKKPDQFVPTIEKVGAVSLRNIAYIYNNATLNKVYGLLNTAEEGEPSLVENSQTLIVQSPFVSGVEEQVVSEQLFPQFSLWGVVVSSITEKPSPVDYAKSFMTRYQKVWDSESGTKEQFDAQVSNFSGPRTVFYVPSGDPWVGHAKAYETDADTELYMSATCLGLNIPLDGKVYPAPILTDFLVTLVDSPEYNILQGQSSLNTYVSGEPVQRSLRMLSDPMPPNPTITSYAVPTKSSSGKGVEGTADEFAFTYEQNLTPSAISAELTKGPSGPAKEINSILGTVLARIKRIDTYYDLATPSLGLTKMLPQLDLFSFLTINQVIDFMKYVPEKTKLEIFDGTLTGGIKIFNPTINPIFGENTEDTFITASRQKGDTSLSEEQLYTEIPLNLNYYNTIISRKLNIL